MSLLLGLFFVAAVIQPPPNPAIKPSAAFAPIRLYNGTWKVTPGMSGAGSDTIRNRCSEFTGYYACEQTVNGKLGALIVFVADATSGQYHTQPIMPDGHATGRGDLSIDGDHWTYLGHDTENGKTTYYRTTNEFLGRDRIHFESAHSADGKMWTVDHKGDEQRVSDVSH